MIIARFSSRILFRFMVTFKSLERNENQETNLQTIFLLLFMFSFQNLVGFNKLILKIHDTLYKYIAKNTQKCDDQKYKNN